MLTEAKRKWVVCLVHACPAPEHFKDPESFKDLQDVLIHCIVAVHGKGGFEALNSTEKWILQAYWTYPDRYDGDILDDLQPNSELVQYAVNIFKLHTDGIFNPQVIVDLLGANQEIHPALQIMLLRGPALPLKTQAKLAMTCRSFRDGFGYDPFLGGHRKIDTTVVKDDLVNTLALHAYHFVSNAIAGPVANQKKRPQDNAVAKISGSTTYQVQDGPRNLLGSNCLAQTEDGRYAVNFLDNGGVLEHTFTLNRNNYLGRNSRVHAEIRHLEYQLDIGRHTFMNVYIDKFCCTFCAIQYLVFGAIDKTPGATYNTTLQWYTFSPYVVYFKSNRIKMWGADVERVFSLLPAPDKLRFLQFLFMAAKQGRNAERPNISVSDIEDCMLIDL
jgi:hypothetical protein